MRILLFVILPLLVLGGVAYHYRSSWEPKVSSIAHSPNANVSVATLPAPPTASPLPQASPTTIPESTPVSEAAVPTAVPELAANMPSTGPGDWGLELALAGAAAGAVFSWVSARRALARALREVRVL
jgi:hypothetical protein